MKNSKKDIGYIIRIAVCCLAFLAAAAYFFYSCKILADNYLAIASMFWLVNFIAASIVFTVILALTVVLIRPFWIAIIAYGLGAVLYCFMIGFSKPVFIAAGLFLVLMVLYLSFEIRQLNNQIRFSTHPLGDKKILICLLLAVMISVAFGTGYLQDSIKRNYVVPSEIKTLLMNQMTNVAEKMLSGQKIAAQQKQAAIKQTKERMQGMMNDAEKNLKQAQKYIPIILGVVAFFCFQTVLFLLSFVSALLIPLAFWFLKTTHFIHIAVEKCETQHLTLRKI